MFLKDICIRFLFSTLTTFMIEIRNQSINKLYCVHTTSVTMVTFVFVSHEVFCTSRDANAALTTKTTIPYTSHRGTETRCGEIGADLFRPSSIALPFAPVADEPSVHVRSDLEFHRLPSLPNPSQTATLRWISNSLIEALRGTMDANLREAAERQLNDGGYKVIGG